MVYGPTRVEEGEPRENTLASKKFENGEMDWLMGSEGEDWLGDRTRKGFG